MLEPESETLRSITQDFCRSPEEGSAGDTFTGGAGVHGARSGAKAMNGVGNLSFIAAVLMNTHGIVPSQTTDAQKRGTVERTRVHGKGLEGNLSGDTPDRDVSVYLPATYAEERSRRYPVVYMLHGFTDDDARWMGLEKHWINLANVLDRTFSADASHEMIVVMPNAFTRFQGSMYSSSATMVIGRAM